MSDTVQAVAILGAIWFLAAVVVSLAVASSFRDPSSKREYRDIDDPADPGRR